MGEWATREGEPTPNLEAALGDAAWMTGMERNSGPDRDGQLCAAAGECESRRNAMGDGPDRLRRALKLRLAQLLGAGDLWQVSGHGDWCRRRSTNAGPRVFASATRDEKQRKLYIKVVNANSEEEPLSISLEGASNVQREAKLVTLSGKSPNATNSMTQPDAVVPVERKIEVSGPKFEQRLAPYSINVLELSY